MQDEVQAIWLKTQKTVLLITHDIDEAIYLSDRVIVFTARPGQIKDEVTISFDRPRSLDVTEHLGLRLWPERFQ
ncbi:MAG: hypothetical protein GEU90_23110 [Gemmatimonas sp.]|nr:hypothetical protein [Gemmatimonas sp.]